MPELTELSLKEMQTGLREGQFSSCELVEAALERIQQLDCCPSVTYLTS